MEWKGEVQPKSCAIFVFGIKVASCLILFSQEFPHFPNWSMDVLTRAERGSERPFLPHQREFALTKWSETWITPE